MSKLTDILKLFCYDPETDGANTFNIPKALNENWEKIDQLVLLAVAAAAAYDPEGSYAVGDYCTQGGKLHKCNTPIPSGEAWTTEHWTETTVAAELRNRVSRAGELVPLGTNILTLAPGRYFVDGVLDTDTANSMNLPVTAWHYEIDVMAAANKTGLVSNYKVIIVYPGSNVVLPYINIMNYGGEWTGWTRISTATPPQEHEISFRSGWSNAAKSSYCKTQEGICVVNCAVYGTGAASYNFIATLPAGFRPNATVCRAAHAHKGGIRGIAEAQIAANGDIAIYSPIEFDYVSFGATFQAQN